MSNTSSVEHGQESGSADRGRDVAIESLRGVAIILMVAGHVIGFDGRGLRVDEDSLWHYAYLSLADIRMPLFAMISGYIYAFARTTRIANYPRLVRAKVRRLIFPLITVATLYYLVKKVVPGTNSEDQHVPWWRIYVFGYEHLWFLQSMFVIFLVVGLLDVLGLLDTRGKWATAATGAIIAYLLVNVPMAYDVFTISGAVRLMPFFILGYGLSRHFRFDLHGRLAISAVALFAVLFCARTLTIVDVFDPHFHMDRMLSAAVGILAILLLYGFRAKIQMKWLAWVGGYSFGIYLLHVFATASSRELLQGVGVNATWQLFVMGLAMGIAAPIAFQWVFRDVNHVQTFILGERRPVRGCIG